MAGSSGGRSGGRLTRKTSIDMSVQETFSDSVYTGDSNAVSYTVESDEGPGGTHETKLQTSFDDVKFHDTQGPAMIGDGICRRIDIVCEYVRVKLTSPANTVSMATIEIYAR